MPAVKVTKAVTVVMMWKLLASGGIATRRQESWASNPRMTETCLFSTASQTDAGIHGASYRVINRAKAAKGQTSTFGLVYFVTCCLIAVATCYVVLRQYLVQWSASLHHVWQQNLFLVLTAWFFHFRPNVILWFAL